MSGGAAEYVMGVLKNKAPSNSGFTALPEEKYYDSYATTDPLTACNEGKCYGHALFETREWYNDKQVFVNSTLPWLLRGRYTSEGKIQGIFHSVSNTGNLDVGYSFRVVLSPI